MENDTGPLYSDVEHEIRYVEQLVRILKFGSHPGTSSD